MIQRLFRNYGAKWSVQGATQWLSHDTGVIPNTNFIKEIIFPFTRLTIILIIFIIIVSMTMADNENNFNVLIIFTINVITIIIIIITRRPFPAKLLLH